MVRVGAIATAAIIVAIVVGIQFGQVRRDRSLDAARAAEWTVTGPPCPTASAQWVGTLKLAHRTPVVFGGLGGFMANGVVDCTEIDAYAGRKVAPYPVCQFSAPFVLALSAGGKQAYFAPGVGRPATVSLRDGRLDCVVGTNISNWYGP